MRRRKAILVVDVGNTSIACGLFRAGRIERRMRVEAASGRKGVVSHLKRLLDGREVAGGAIASVVPELTGAWKRGMAAVCGGDVLEVSAGLELGVGISYPRPEGIGADRLANAAGAAARYRLPVIIVDFGTAVTFDVVEAERGYVGGIIAPGIPLMFEYLAERTALLPALKPGQGRRVRHSVGRSTEEAMRLGAHWGYPAMIRGIVEHLRLGNRIPDSGLVLTGGYARKMLKAVREYDARAVLDMDLTLFGLGRIFELNRT